MKLLSPAAHQHNGKASSERVGKASSSKGVVWNASGNHQSWYPTVPPTEDHAEQSTTLYSIHESREDFMRDQHWPAESTDSKQRWRSVKHMYTFQHF